MGSFDTISLYISHFPKDVQKLLELVRKAIQKEVPDAEETIRYQMPTYRLNGKNLVHFAAWKTHIGFYPTPSGTENFQKDLKFYKYAKGSIQFPIHKPMPLSLIRKIVRFRVKEVTEKSKTA